MSKQKLSFNALRGECVISLGGEERRLRLNNNALNIMCQRRGISLGELFNQLKNQDPMEMLSFMSDLIKASFINECHYNGITDYPNDIVLDAWIGDITDEDTNKVMKMLNSSMKLTEGESEGNAQTPAAKV